MWPILLALVPAFGWGFQGIVMQKVGGTTANKQMGMVLTTLLFGIVVLIFHPINWSWTLIAAAAINGIPWSIAQILQIKSFDYLGVARAMPLSTGMQLVFTTLLGALFFHEWTHGWQFGFGICALVVIIVGVACTAFQEKSEDKGPSNLKARPAHHPDLLTAVYQLRRRRQVLLGLQLGHAVPAGRVHGARHDNHLLLHERQGRDGPRNRRVRQEELDEHEHRRPVRHREPHRDAVQ